MLYVLRIERLAYQSRARNNSAILQVADHCRFGTQAEKQLGCAAVGAVGGWRPPFLPPARYQGRSMKLSAKALGLTIAVLWGGAMFLIGMLCMLAPPYGVDFFVVMGSLYPGLYGAGTLQEVLLGTAYGFVDGLLGGLLIAWVYNSFSARDGK
jgi:hypothetical protein